MPQGIGKLKDKARVRFPRFSSFVERYHITFSAIGIALLVSFVAWIGILQHATENTVTHIRGDVNVIKQQSSCAPKGNGEPKRPKRCRESFHTIIHKILTPVEACEFLERGAPVIRIGGKPIPEVECVRPRAESKALSPHHQSSGADSGKSTAGGSDHAAPEPQSTGGNTGGSPSGVAPGSHHGGSGGGSHHHGNPAPAPAPESTPQPTPEPAGPGASGGAGQSDESHASEHAEETPAPGNKVLPSVTAPLEHTVCGAPVAGKIVCE